ncbi:MAG: hypothetical protein C4539_17680 [Ignavibacteriales bacterium]|nr:MAG: hypothetical protein C4539_17680 [Ignavibacteriales bacterium]
MKNIIAILLLSLLILGCSKDSNTTDNNINDLTSGSDSPNTAHFNFAAVEKQAKTLDSNSRLKSISAENVKIDGTADSWIFKYSSVNIGSYTSKYFYFRSFDKTVKCDSIIETKTTVGDAFISETWFNSDKAISIAENSGGKNFRDENPDNAISASLSQAVIYNASPTWYIQYSSKTNKEKNFRIIVNAVNGSFSLFQ